MEVIVAVVAAAVVAALTLTKYLQFLRFIKIKTDKS